MAFIPVPDAAKAAIKFLQYGQQMVNTLWFKLPGGWTTSDLTDLATALNSWVVAELLPQLSNTVTFLGTEARDMSAAGAEGVDIIVPGGSPGLNPNAPMPSNVTAAIKFGTGLTGRSNRGRNFIPGFASNNILNDRVTSAAQAFFQTAYELLPTYIVGLGAEHVVASLYSGVDGSGNPIPRASGITNAVVSYALNTALDSMRRRLLERGA